ncbi:MAG: peptidoglycan-associated outer rane lipoprotein [Labilithrix sp.]|nr:peptidoglycan-associated outer rane lipoprotein [Labilithrix sp.]
MPVMVSRLSLCALGITLSLSLVAGCDAPGLSRKAKAPTSPGQQGIGQATTTGAPLPDKDNMMTGPVVETVGLSVSNAIAKACGIAARADGKQVAPSFEYDSAALAEEDRVLLAQVARCLTEGALKGRKVTLVGRADQRGEPEYNMTLGGSRADTVKRYMVDLGVGRERMLGTSRGEMDATGKDEAGFAHDRRVDVELVN